MARIISRIRGAGWLHSMENRLVMCGLIWLPSPRVNLPCDIACRSHPMLASNIGLRANATAIDVPRSIVVVWSAAMAIGRNGSCDVSDDQAPEKPAASRSAATLPASRNDPERLASTFIYTDRSEMRTLRCQSWSRRNCSSSAASSSPVSISSEGPPPPMTSTESSVGVVQLFELANHARMLFVAGDHRVESLGMFHGVGSQPGSVDDEAGCLAQAIEQRGAGGGKQTGRRIVRHLRPNSERGNAPVVQLAFERCGDTRRHVE